MKNIFLITLLLSTLVFAQFRDQNVFKPTVSDGMVDRSNNYILGIFNPSKFSMAQSYSMSYSASGSSGLALGVYTNAMMYQFTDNLNLQVDASLMHSPYNTFSKNFQNDLNGIYVSRAQLNYSVSKDFKISLLYNNLPRASYYSGNSLGYDPFYDFTRNP